MTLVRHSPAAFALHVPEATTVFPSPVGGHATIDHVPVDELSKLNPCTWNVQPGCGSFATTGSFSVSPAWILMVPLLPGGLVLFAPPFGDPGSAAAGIANEIASMNA